MAFTEKELLGWIFSELKSSDRVQIKPGDDCTAVSVDGKALVLVSTDMLLEGTHFTLDIGPHAIGRKTIAVSLSDAAAMGVRPVAVVATVAFTRPVTREIRRSGRYLDAQGFAPQTRDDIDKIVDFFISLP